MDIFIIILELNSMASHVSIQDIEIATIHLLQMEEMIVMIMDMVEKKKNALNAGESGYHNSTKDGVNGHTGQAVVKVQVKGIGQSKLDTKHVLLHKQEFVDVEMLEIITGNGINRNIGYNLKEILEIGDMIQVEIGSVIYKCLRIFQRVTKKFGMSSTIYSAND